MDDERTDGGRPANLLSQAIELAHDALHGQVDASGAPAIRHPLAVMVAMGGEDAKIVAVLHSVQDEWWLPSIRAMLPERLLMALLALARPAEETETVHFDAVLVDPLALQVKLACIADLASPDSLAKLDRFTARRRHGECSADAAHLGTTLPAVLDRWNDGRSPYTS